LPIHVPMSLESGGLVVVPGVPGQPTVLRFHWTFREAGFNNEVGVFVADDASGAVGGVRPGDPGYANAVLSSASRQVAFHHGEGQGAFRDLALPAGAYLGFYLVVNATTETALAGA